MSDVHPQGHQFGRQSGKAPEIALRPPVLCVDVLALGPTEIYESSPERVHEGRVGRRTPVTDEPDPVHSPHRLRLDSEWRGHEGDSARDEGAPAQLSDHLIRTRQDRWRDRQAKRLRGLQVDDEL